MGVKSRQINKAATNSRALEQACEKYRQLMRSQPDDAFGTISISSTIQNGVVDRIVVNQTETIKVEPITA